MDRVYFISGMVCVHIECADLAGFLGELTKASAAVRDISYLNGLCASLWISRRDYHKLELLAERKGASVRASSQAGVYWHIRQWFRRPVLLTGIGLVLFLSLFLPERILFVSVEGNQKISSREIMECAENFGLSFGSYRRHVRSETIKNVLLESIPTLQWVGVNTSGCVAVISVREREQTDLPEEEYPVSSIVAKRDGVIVSCTGTKGNVLCKPGQAVKQGDVLISGYTDCGLSIRAEQARGDVYAQTIRSMTVFAPAPVVQKGDIIHKEEKYALLIGKNRINFYKDSGILPYGCDMIYEQYYAILPGGFQLPVAIVKETWYTYDYTAVSASEDAAFEQTQDFARDYLHQHMVGGQILECELSGQKEKGVYILNGKYTCIEMIGKVRREEILNGYG